MRILSKIVFVLLIGLISNEKTYCQYVADVEAHENIFKTDLIEVKNESGNSKELVIEIKNISNKIQLISISKTGQINNRSDVMVSLSYSHITDPLLLPKLQMPWYPLNPNESIEITETVMVDEISKIKFLFDFMPKENYPYKKLKKGKYKKYYWFIRMIKGKNIKNDFYMILLKDYYELFSNEQKIHNFYREFEVNK